MSPTPSQLDREVLAIKRTAARLRGSNLCIPLTGEELVRSVPASRFQVPPFVAKNGGDAAHAELASLLDELRQFNAEHVGESVLHVATFLSVTGLKRDLELRIQVWAIRYLWARVRSLVSDSTSTGLRVLVVETLAAECEEVLASLGRDFDTICPAFLGLTLDFMPWQAYRFAFEDLSIPVKAQRCPTVSLPPLMALNARNWNVDRLGRFFRRLNAGFSREDKAAANAMTDTRLRSRLAVMAAEIQWMRPIVERDGEFEQAAFQLGSDRHVGWMWSARQGIGSIISASSAETLQRYAIQGATEDAVAFGYDGIIFDSVLPWLPAGRYALHAAHRPLVLNFVLLERFHAKLSAIFERAHLSAIRSAALIGVRSLRTDEELIVAAYGDSAEARAQIASRPDQRIAVLRLDRFLRLLEERFRCVVRRGARGEYKIRRTGRKSWTLRGHVSELTTAYVVREAFVRLGIPVLDGVAAIAGS